MTMDHDSAVHIKGYLVVFGSLVGLTAFAYALNELPATTVGTYAYVNPVVAVILGRVILKEALTPGLLAGGVPILASVLITTRHGSFTNRYHSNPIAHCSAWTNDLFLYLIGVMPQPASSSVSLLNHFPP